MTLTGILPTTYRCVVCVCVCACVCVHVHVHVCRVTSFFTTPGHGTGVEGWPAAKGSHLQTTHYSKSVEHVPGWRCCVWGCSLDMSELVSAPCAQGTIEEKVYQRQVSKQGLSGAVVDAKASTPAQFSREELKVSTLRERLLHEMSRVREQRVKMVCMRVSLLCVMFHYVVAGSVLSSRQQHL